MPKPKHVKFQFQLDTDLKQLLDSAARADDRDTAALLRTLIREHCPKIIEERHAIATSAKRV